MAYRRSATLLLCAWRGLGSSSRHSTRARQPGPGTASGGDNARSFVVAAWRARDGGGSAAAAARWCCRSGDLGAAILESVSRSAFRESAVPKPPLQPGLRIVGRVLQPPRADRGPEDDHAWRASRASLPASLAVRRPATRAVALVNGGPLPRLRGGRGPVHAVLEGTGSRRPGSHRYVARFVVAIAVSPQLRGPSCEQCRPGSAPAGGARRARDTCRSGPSRRPGPAAMPPAAAAGAGDPVGTSPSPFSGPAIRRTPSIGSRSPSSVIPVSFAVFPPTASVYEGGVTR